jgi:hypothetical protein
VPTGCGYRYQTCKRGSERRGGENPKKNPVVVVAASPHAIKEHKTNTTISAALSAHGRPTGEQMAAVAPVPSVLQGFGKNLGIAAAKIASNC